MRNSVEIEHQLQLVQLALASLSDLEHELEFELSEAQRLELRAVELAHL